MRPPPPQSTATPSTTAQQATPSASIAPVSAPSLEPVAAPLTDAADVKKFLAALGTSLIDAGRKLRLADPKDPIGYRLLRAGIYLPILKAPVVTSGNRTPVPPPPAGDTVVVVPPAQPGRPE